MKAPSPQFSIEIPKLDVTHSNSLNGQSPQSRDNSSNRSPNRPIPIIRINSFTPDTRRPSSSASTISSRSGWSRPQSSELSDLTVSRPPSLGRQGSDSSDLSEIDSDSDSGQKDSRTALKPIEANHPNKKKRKIVEDVKGGVKKARSAPKYIGQLLPNGQRAPIGCHQCHHTFDPALKMLCRCTNIRAITSTGKPCKAHPCNTSYCKRCVTNRYGQDPDTIIASGEWVCPCCQQCCNCSLCRRAQGLAPTGILAQAAREKGVASAHDVLKIDPSAQGHGAEHQHSKKPKASTSPKTTKGKSPKSKGKGRLAQSKLVNGAGPSKSIAAVPKMDAPKPPPPPPKAIQPPTLSSVVLPEDLFAASPDILNESILSRFHIREFVYRFRSVLFPGLSNEVRKVGRKPALDILNGLAEDFFGFWSEDFGPRYLVGQILTLIDRTTNPPPQKPPYYDSDEDELDDEDESIESEKVELLRQAIGEAKTLSLTGEGWKCWETLTSYLRLDGIDLGLLTRAGVTPDVDDDGGVRTRNASRMASPDRKVQIVEIFLQRALVCDAIREEIQESLDSFAPIKLAMWKAKKEYQEARTIRDAAKPKDSHVVAMEEWRNGQLDDRFDHESIISELYVQIVSPKLRFGPIGYDVANNAYYIPTPSFVTVASPETLNDIPASLSWSVLIHGPGTDKSSTKSDWYLVTGFADIRRLADWIEIEAKLSDHAKVVAEYQEKVEALRSPKKSLKKSTPTKVKAISWDDAPTSVRTAKDVVDLVTNLKSFADFVDFKTFEPYYSDRKKERSKLNRGKRKVFGPIIDDDGFMMLA